MKKHCAQAYADLSAWVLLLVTALDIVILSMMSVCVGTIVFVVVEYLTTIDGSMCVICSIAVDARYVAYMHSFYRPTEIFLCSLLVFACHQLFDLTC